MDESEIPIDIHTSKLLEWLISRRHVPRDWNKQVLPIREKINEAIKDMPANEEITTLLSGSYINYYHCQRLIEILKETEANSKNVFGQYSSKRMKDWMEIVKMYEKDNIYLGEVASILQRNVIYEVPGLRKQITRTVNLKNDYDKKQNSYEKMAESIQKDFVSHCASLGIKGVKVKQELIDKAAEFPQMCEKIMPKITALKPVVSFYQNVVASLLSSKKPVLDMLQYIIENSNTTVYQWKYGKVPNSLETIALIAEEETVEDNDEIDFGIDLNTDEDIDWGISTVDTDIEVENVVAETVSQNKNVAKGEDAYSLLGNMGTRNLIINDVLELEAFLKVRLHEMNSEADGLALTLLPESLQMYDMKTVQNMIGDVETVLNCLTDPVSLHYLNITTSQKYVDQLADKLKQKLNSYEKILASKEFVKKQREEIIEEGEAIKPKVELLIKKSKELQDLIEKDISKRYKGRPVNLIAGANIL